jgi:pimeloyl-ACP methyl ester carboxylesterase
MTEEYHALIHGLGSSADAGHDEIGFLATVYRVIVIDLPGCAKSDFSEIFRNLS